MGARGKESAAAKETQPAARLVPKKRMKAPDELTKEQKAEWRAIVNSLPADYFKPADRSLLRAYCVASAAVNEAATSLANDGVTIDNGHGRKIPNAAIHVCTAMMSAMAQMSVKLRLCPQSRYDDRVAGTKANAEPDAQKPWEQGK